MGNIPADFDVLIKDLVRQNARIVFDLFRKRISFTARKFTHNYARYLEEAFRKYSRIKTLICKTEPKYLYDFFECNSLSFKNRNISAKNLQSLLDISPYLLISGSAGMGKSTMMRHFFLSALSHLDKIPLFVELRELNSSDISLYDCILQGINRFSPRLEPELFEYALQAGTFIILLDGFDEIISQKRPKTLKQLERLIDKYPDNRLIVSSRPDPSLESLTELTVLKTVEFSKKQSLSLIRRMDYDPEIKSRFKKQLAQELYDRHTSFASNPLLLTIMLITFESYAHIPDKKHIFYENAFETLFFKHDATKAGFRREMCSDLPIDRFRQVFSRFCFNTIILGKSAFSYTEICQELRGISEDQAFDVESYVSDLEKSLCLIMLDGTEYRFTHRSFQEYFAALCIKELPKNEYKRFCNILRDDHPDMLGMVYDMAAEKFEQDYMLPVFRSLERNFKDCEDRKVRALELLAPKVFITSGGSGHVSLLIDGFRKYFWVLRLVRMFIRRYTPGIIDRNKENLIFYEALNVPERPMHALDAKELLKDTRLMRLFWQTNAGHMVETASRMYQTLLEKGERKSQGFKHLLKRYSSGA